MAFRLIVAAIGLALVGASCSGRSLSTTPSPSTTPSSTPSSPRAARHNAPSVERIQIKGRVEPAPSKCRPRTVARLIIGFLSAVDRGAVEEIPQFFDPQMGWYSVTEGNSRRDNRHFVANEVDELTRYFAKRSRQNERMFLREVNVGYEKARDVGHIA